MFTPAEGMSYNTLTVPYPEDTQHLRYITRIIVDAIRSRNCISHNINGAYLIWCIADWYCAQLAATLIAADATFTHKLQTWTE